MSKILFRSTCDIIKDVGITNERGMGDYVLLVPNEAIQVIEVQEGDYNKEGDKYKYRNGKVIEKFLLSPKKGRREYIDFIERYELYNILGYKLCSLQVFNRDKWYHKLFIPDYREKFLLKMNDPKYQAEAINLWEDISISVKEQILLKQNEEDLYTYFILDYHIPDGISSETKSKILEKMTTDDKILNAIKRMRELDINAISRALDKIKDEKYIVEAISTLRTKKDICLKLVSKIKDEKMLVDALKYIDIPMELRREVFYNLTAENMYNAMQCWKDIDCDMLEYAINKIEDDGILFKIAMDYFSGRYSYYSLKAYNKIKDQTLKENFYKLRGERR